MVGDILDANGNERAFKWVDGPTSLPSLSGTRSGAEDINDAGVVVGWYDSGGTLYSALIRPTGVETIGAPGTLTNLTSINSVGVSVGSGIDAGGSSVNYRYANGILAPLVVPTSPACATPIVTSVSDAGTIAGWCLNQAVAFLFSNGVVETFAYPGASQTAFTGLSASGSVAGSAAFDDPLGQIYGGIFMHTAYLADPVPDLLAGAAVASNLSEPEHLELLASGGRTVQGVAADGVARIVIKIPTTAPGQQVSVRLLNDHVPRAPSSSEQEDGALLALSAQSNAVSQMTVNAVDTSQGPTAFAIYRAPADFPRIGTPAAQGAFGPDDLKASRQVFLEITPQGESSYIKAVEIVRPPVMLVHGLWSNKGSWKDFTPLGRGLDPRFSVDFADYSQLVDVVAVVPEPPPGSLNRVKANSLGLLYNTSRVREQTAEHIDKFRAGRNPVSAAVAAAQADVVAHSMGGVITRTWATLPDYIEPWAFGHGAIHKLVTINTPHLGSSLAAALLHPDDACVRNRLVEIDLLDIPFATIKPGNFSLLSAEIAGVGWVDGAVGDLVDAPLSPALQRISASAAPIPTHFVGTYYTKWSQVGSFANSELRIQCDSHSPLSRSLTETGWPLLFGSEANDGVVGRNSQVNGSEQSAATVWSGYAHSGGILKLGLEPPHALYPGLVQGSASDALNRPWYVETYFRPTPTP